MPLQLQSFTGLSGFLSEFRLQQNQGAALFARSPRTLRRWARRGRCPQNVLDTIFVIRTARPPMTGSFYREQRASCPEWTARLAAPGPQRARRHKLVDLAHTDVINRMPDSAWRTLRAAGYSPEDATAKVETWQRCNVARRAAREEARRLGRRGVRAGYMRLYRRRISARAAES